ncbi:MAG: hypothetical protein K9M96_08645 [Deltaproteobacteria bacterium]|nr:hypothetical protein [Deltaproteobacteria bacterium]MCF8119028.1 hypothetical protein [Deltaproteobacteria bacterium]
MRELIAIASFVMAVIGGLATMFHNEKDKQIMGAIVGGVFLISFLINVRPESMLVLRAACMVAFAVAITGGVVTIFSNDGDRRSSAIGTGIVSLGTSLLILFMYLEFSPI